MNKLEYITNEMKKIKEEIFNIKQKTRYDLSNATLSSDRTKIYSDYKTELSKLKNDKNLQNKYKLLKKKQLELTKSDSSKGKLIKQMMKTYKCTNDTTPSLNTNMVNNYLLTDSTTIVESCKSVDDSTCDDSTYSSCDVECNTVSSCNDICTITLTKSEQKSILAYYDYLCRLKAVLE